MKESEATFMPTCLVVNIARFPAYAAPITPSIATFSLMDHSL